ncbi:putative tetratricopeptide-like helical domain superfamily [Dioscorea sansibarensis]
MMKKHVLLLRRSLVLWRKSKLFLRLISSCQRFPSNQSTYCKDLSDASVLLFDVRRGNSRLSSLGRSRDAASARQLFDRMPHRDVVTYSSMISIYLKEGEILEAERLFGEMPERNVVVESAMIDGYGKVGRIDDARVLFDQMPVRNVYSWTSLVSGYCRVGRVDDARKLFEQMPDKNVVSWTTLFLGYAQNGLISDARSVFDQMPEKNVVSWTAMIKVYVDNGRLAEGRELFDEMPYRNIYSWNVMILGYLDGNRASEAIELFWLMPQRNTVSWTTMVTGLARNGLIERAREFFDQMLEKDAAAWNAMITAYVDNGFVAEAREVFDRMPDKNVVSWNAMIDGYVKNECQEEALELFRLMILSPVKRNETTLTSVLVACERIAEIMQIHALALRLGFESDTSLTNALVSIYSKTGDLASACLAFKELVIKDVVTWTSMILAYSNHGCGEYALQVFAQMLRQGEKPDGITFVGVLSACSHIGLVRKGRRVFNSMSLAYNVEPKAEHYSCLVDLLGRFGYIEEAKSVVSRMPPSECDEAVLGALLGACRVHNKIEVASGIGEQLIQLEQSGSGSYVLLANVYASCGMWTDVGRVRKLMKEKNVKKVPGYSVIEVNMRSHLFYAGDRLHPQAKELYDMLHLVLLPQMKMKDMHAHSLLTESNGMKTH